MVKYLPTISQTVKEDLCTGCATCISLCPNAAIELIKDEDKGTYRPRLSEEKCNLCGICYHVCPGHSVDFTQLSSEIFGKSLENIYVGKYISFYLGHSTNHNIRYNSSSGGLVTQLLIFALEEGIIDGALVTRMNKDYPLEPEPFIARTSEEIIEASKSKYCPVPANYALKEILDSAEGERFAVVGLPCHIHGIRKAETINKKLKERIVLHVGLFCNHTPNFIATDFLLKKLKIKRNDVRKLDYRGEGWPGKTKIISGMGELLLPFSWKFLGSYFFTPLRCFLCSDGVNELSDISFADAWLPEFSKEKIGKSLFISKSELGDKLVKMMSSRGKIEIDEIPIERMIPSFIRMLNFKKSNIGARIKVLNKDIMYDNIFVSGRLDIFIALFPFISLQLCKSQFVRNILIYLPFKALWIFSLPYLFLYTIKGRLLVKSKEQILNKGFKSKKEIDK